MAGSAIRIAILANASQAKQELNGVAGTAEKIGGKFAKLRAPALAAVGGIALLGKASVKAASDAQQSLGATETVFGKYADTVIRTSDKAAQKYGLSANSYRENANLIGSLFKNQGVSVDQLAGKTDKMISTAADLSATFGGTTKDAVEALGSAFKGEFDPLERYGISIKQSTINAALAAKGEDKLTGAALAAAKQRATTALITKQAGGALGSFGREANTLAGQQQRLSATWENAKAKLGKSLLPVLTQGAQLFTKLTSAMAANPGATKIVIAAIAGLALVVLAAGAAQKVYTAAMVISTGAQATYNGVMALGSKAALGTRIQLGLLKVQQLAFAAASKVMAAAQVALNIVMAANPITLVILAIVALVAIFVIAYKKSETFRNIVNAAWQGIKTAAVAVFGFLKTFIGAVFSAIKAVITTYVKVYVTVIKAAWNAIKAVTSAVWRGIKTVVSAVVRFIVGFFRTQFNIAKTVIVGAWNFIKAATSRVWNGLKNIVRTAVAGLMAIVRGIKGKVTGFFSGAAGWLASAGRKIISGLIGGIVSMFDSVRRTLGNLTSKLTSWKGPPKRDAKLLTPAGQSIIQSLIDGFDNQTPKVKKTLQALSKDIETFSASPSATVSLSAAQSDYARRNAAGSGSQEFTIRLSAEQLSAVQRGREVKADIKAYEKAGGK